MSTVNVEEVISYLNTLLSDTLKSELLTDEKKKAVATIKKVYMWVKETAPDMARKEKHLQELMNRLMAQNYQPGGEVDAEGFESKKLKETGDNLLDAIQMLEKLLLDVGMDRANYSDDKLKKTTKKVKEQMREMKEDRDDSIKSLEAIKGMDFDGVDPKDLPGLKEEKEKQKDDVKKAKDDVELTQKANDGNEAVIKKLKAEYKDLVKGNEKGNQQLADEEVKRRALHNEVQDLRGNIRVYCRCRKYLPKESKNPYDIPHIDFIDEYNLVIKKEQSGMRRAFSKSKDGSDADDGFIKESFKFDRVFGPKTTQEEIFIEVEPLIQSVLDGFNVCMFAYGQTGAGKTYTMSGGKGDERGVIPRAIEFIFEKIKEYEKQGWSYKCKVDIVEVYNDEIRDLLQPYKEGVSYEIKEKEEDSGSKGGHVTDVIVTNLRCPEVTNAKEVFKLLDEGAARRVTTATECNAESSRSHSVFQLKINATDPKKNKYYSVLNLIDLAGSERLEQSGVSGQQKLEAISINKSLTTLGDVIQAIGKGSKHVPYRDCTLTYLLRVGLGGNSKTMMLLGINPNVEFYNNSISSLRFGKKVNQTHVGAATKAK